MTYAPIVRIFLRYGSAASFVGAPQIGEMLAADPDVVMTGSLLIAGAVEGFYAFAKKKGGAT